MSERMMSHYLIWSEEHGAWWGPGNAGYTRSVAKAGRYDLAEARAIVEAANEYLHAGEFSELLVPEPFEFNPGLLKQ